VKSGIKTEVVIKGWLVGLTVHLRDIDRIMTDKENPNYVQKTCPSATNPTRNALALNQFL
jgi:hypothetical protein